MYSENKSTHNHYCPKKDEYTQSDFHLLSFPKLYTFLFLMLKYKRFCDEYFCLYSESQHVPSERTR